MFNSLASYILGNGNRNTDITQDDQQFSGAETDEAINKFKFVAANCDDEEVNEWILVEKGDGDCTPQQTDSEEEIPFVEIKNSRAVRARNGQSYSTIGSHDGALNSLPSSPVPNSMDESWFVTPPPCFTATDPINVEISPLENLLIEHPSMSVYHSIRGSMPRTVQQDVVDDNVVLVVDLDNPNLSPIHPAERNSGQTMIGRTNRAENHAHQLTAQQVKQVIHTKHSQREEKKKIRSQMCRNALDRANKVRESNGKGRSKRTEIYQPKFISRANNNRKC